MIQVRDVPEHVHGTLKSRAAREGMSLSDFIKRELERAAERPTLQEWLDRTLEAKPIPAKKSAARPFSMLQWSLNFLTNGKMANSIRSKLAGADESILVPHLLDIEVLSAIRRLTAGQRMDPHRNAQFLMDLAALPAQRYSHTPLIG